MCVFQLFLILVSLPQLMFTVGQCILILTTENYEFGLTVGFSFVILVLAYPIVYLVVSLQTTCLL